MKKLLTIFTLLITACDGPDYLESKNKDDLGAVSIRYFRDTRTNLCYAEQGAANSYSFTCVPCDSVKKFIK